MAPARRSDCDSPQRAAPCGFFAETYNTGLPTEPSPKSSYQYPIMAFGRKRRPASPNNKRRSKLKTPKKDPLFIDGIKPKPMYVDYKDLELLSKLTNRHGRIVSRRKSGCHAASQNAVARAIKRARFMALMPYVGD